LVTPSSSSCIWILTVTFPHSFRFVTLFADVIGRRDPEPTPPNATEAWEVRIHTHTHTHTHTQRERHTDGVGNGKKRKKSEKAQNQNEKEMPAWK